MSEGKKPPGRGLGRGLSALMGEAAGPPSPAPDTGARGQRALPTASLKPGKFQPRRHFDDTAIAGLADSLRAQGMLQPILVRKLAGNVESYEIIAGERRWRAAQVAGLHEVPVLIKALTDEQALEIALVENLQREDLTPIEEAEAYRRLMDEFAHTQDGLAKHLGKSRSHVTNTMRLLTLPDAVKAMLDAGELSAGHARALLVSVDPEKLARRVVAEGLSVRQTEALVRAESEPKKGKGAAKGGAKPKGDADVRALERDLAKTLGLEVKLTVKGKGGDLTIRYTDLDQLDALLAKLGQAKR
jgi:ParB family chromosome partitioning protein